MSKLIVGTMLALFLTSTLGGAAAAETEKADALAREAAQRFLKATLARDLSGAMKVVDTPWCHDARKIIKDKEELRETFLKAFEKPNLFRDAKIHIRAVGTLEQIREKHRGPPTRSVSLGEVLGKDGRVALVEIEHDGRFETVWIGVCLEKGEAKVVGIVD